MLWWCWSLVWMSSERSVVSDVDVHLNNLSEVINRVINRVVRSSFLSRKSRLLVLRTWFGNTNHIVTINTPFFYWKCPNSFLQKETYIFVKKTSVNYFWSTGQKIYKSLFRNRPADRNELFQPGRMVLIT